MYKEHEQLYDVDDQLVLWKYMDFAKFVNILTTGCIWFNRIDSFEDVYEGVYPPANKRKRKEVYGDCKGDREKLPRGMGYQLHQPDGGLHKHPVQGFPENKSIRLLP